MIRIRIAIVSMVLAGPAVLFAAGPGTERSTSAKPQAPASAPMPADLERQRERERMENEKLKLEVDRLRAEIEKLKADTPGVKKRDAELAKLEAEADNVTPWYASPLGVFVGFAGVALTVWFGYGSTVRTRIGAFDMKLYEERLKAYGNLIAATDAFAMHFPRRPLDQSLCTRTGRALRSEYFGMPGWLLTVDARNRYMTLAHALTRAAAAGRLNVPGNDADYARWISEAQLDTYRRILGLAAAPDGTKFTAEEEMKRCAEHEFGKDVDSAAERLRLQSKPDPGSRSPADKAAAMLFQDYVVLQFASSRLRTELSRDVSGRRPLTELAEGA